MKGSDFKALAAKTVGDDDVVIIADHLGRSHDVKLFPFAGASKVAGQKVFVVGPNFNRPKAPVPAYTPLPKQEWWPEDPLNWPQVQATVVRFRDDTSPDTAKEFLRGFFEKHNLSSTKLSHLELVPELWPMMVADLRARYMA